MFGSASTATVSSDGCYIYKADYEADPASGHGVIGAYGDNAITLLTEVNHPDLAQLRADCPKDVVVPSEIDGAPIRFIANNAFANLGLTSAVLPIGFLEIGEEAFASNQIASLVFEPGEPKTRTILGYGAFRFNKITRLNLPAYVSLFSETSETTFQFQNPLGGDILEAVFAGDEVATRDLLKSIWFVQISTDDPLVKSEIVLAPELGWGFDFNQDGGMDDYFSLGGHIVNAGSITINYLSKTNQALKQSVTMAGELGDGAVLQNYLANDWQQWPVSPEDANPDFHDLTPEEQDALRAIYQSDIDAILSHYWTVGQQVTVTVPDIPGYITPAPANRTFALTAGETAVDLVYAQPTSNSTTTTTTTTTNPSAPNTGVGASVQPIVVASAVGLLLAGAVLKKRFNI